MTKSGGDGQSGPVTGQLATPLEVRLVGPGGSPISGAAVTWSANAAVGQITPLSSVTNADGRASARITLGRNVGAHQVTARIADLSPVSFGVTTTACPVASVTIVQGNGQSGVAGSALGTPLIVRVADGAGNPVVGAAVTWEGAGSVTPSTTASNAQGQVSVIWTPANASGTQTMTAGLGCSARSFSATVRKRVSTVSISPSPTSIEVGTSVQLGATLRDEDGTVLGGIPVTWLSSNASVASISSSGMLTGNGEGTATIRAAAEGVTRQLVVAVVVPPPSREPVASISITPSAPRVKVGGTAQLSAKPLDAAGNLVADAAVAWSSLTTGLATVTQAGVVRGIAVGDATIRATSEGVTRTVTVRVVPNSPPGVPVMIDILGGNQQTGPAGEELVVQLMARVTDSDGNPVPNVFVAWAGDGFPFADVTATTAQGITRNYWTLESTRGAQKLDLYTWDFGTGTRGVLLGSFTATAVP